MRTLTIAPRELALAGLLGAAAMLLPTLFHLVQLGRVLMPMYLPLMLLPFLVRPLPAALTAGVVPLLSGALTGMPPFYPPVAVLMSVELAVMAALIAGVRGRWFRANPYLVLAPVLLLGRGLHVALVYAAAAMMDLPARFLAGVSLISGWPGVVLMMIVVPPLALQVGAAARKELEA